MLTTKQRAYLRGESNTVEAILHIGKDMIDENVVIQLNDAFKNRELVKGRVLNNSLYAAKEAAAELAEKSGAEVVQTIGHTFVLYKKHDAVKDTPKPKSAEGRVNGTVRNAPRKPNKKPMGGGRPANGTRTYGDRSNNGRSAVDRPAYGDRTNNSRPAGDRPAYGDRPSNSRLAGDRPAYGDRPSNSRPAGDRPAYGSRPSNGRPAGNKNNAGKRFEK